jgi:murein DD-endopeptidase MepM/ murein hydrolase activator NlpD
MAGVNTNEAVGWAGGHAPWQQGDPVLSSDVSTAEPTAGMEGQDRVRRHRLVVPALPRRRALLVTLRAQLLMAAFLFVVSAWLTVTTVSFVGSRSLLTNKTDYISNLERAYSGLLTESQTSTESLVRELEALEHSEQQQRLAIEELDGIQKSLQRQLEARERELAAHERGRGRDQERLAMLEEANAQATQQLASLLRHRASLETQLVTTEDRLAEVTRQRDSSRRVEQGLRWQVARLETQLGGLAANREAAQLWFKDWVASSVESLEQLFIGTGVDLEILVARAAAIDGIGQGGPLQGLDLHAAPVVPVALTGDPITDRIRRLTALQKLASSLPLAPPLDHFHFTSYYGKRKDPFTRNWAFHGGLDFGAAAGSRIMATAPGGVIRAGDYGPYGNMVEIDHGMGVTTRYAHMNSIEVEVGQEVDFRQPIGVIGNTGRSTGRHLHYEIRIDDQPFDPAKFLEAGRYLVDIFNLRQQQQAGSSPDHG